MAHRLARLLTALALVVGFGAGMSSGPAGATPMPPPATNQPSSVQPSSADWWW